jgi:hypothetical protein
LLTDGCGSALRFLRIYDSPPCIYISHYCRAIPFYDAQDDSGYYRRDCTSDRAHERGNISNSDCGYNPADFCSDRAAELSDDCAHKRSDFADDCAHYHENNCGHDRSDYRRNHRSDNRAHHGSDYRPDHDYSASDDCSDHCHDSCDNRDSSDNSPDRCYRVTDCSDRPDYCADCRTNRRADDLAHKRADFADHSGNNCANVRSDYRSDICTDSRYCHVNFADYPSGHFTDFARSDRAHDTNLLHHTEQRVQSHQPLQHLERQRHCFRSD